MREKFSILVVDDHKNWRDTIQSLLSSDYDVVPAASYSQGLQAYCDKFPPYHVVIADMRLDETDTANEDGLRLIAEVQKQGGYTQTIVVTGYPSVDTVKRALRGYEAYEYIEKHPDSGEFDLKGFLKHVKRATAKAEKGKRMWERVRAREAWISHCKEAFSVFPEIDPGVDERLCFVVMPFSEDFDLVHAYISGAVEDCPNCKCERADDIHTPGVLMNQIWVSINKAGVIIADLTNRNPNVFYELGLCHALGKRVILLTQQQKDVPEHLISLRCIQYARTVKGLVRLRRQLTDAIQDGLNIADEEWNLFRKRGYGSDDIDYSCCVVLIPQATATVDGVAGEHDLAKSSRQLYNELVRELLDSERLTVLQPGDVFSPRLAIEGVWEQLNRAPLVIADMSSRSPEVFYAVGLAHVLYKPVIMLTSEPKSVPTDLSHVRYIRYMRAPSTSEITKAEFVEELRAAIRDIFKHY
jgi:ActR/RegA family two-component response regulator